MLYWYCGKATRLEWAKRPINCNQEGFHIWYLGECHKIFVAASYRPYIHFMIFAQPLMLNLVISSTGLCLSSSRHNDHRIILCINFAKIFMVELCEISSENVTVSFFWSSHYGLWRKYMYVHRCNVHESALQCFLLSMEGNWTNGAGVLRKMFHICSQGIAVNCIWALKLPH